MKVMVAWTSEAALTAQMSMHITVHGHPHTHLEWFLIGPGAEWLVDTVKSGLIWLRIQNHKLSGEYMLELRRQAGQFEYEVRILLMKLVAFSVQNYRSIKSTPRIELSNLTVLVGPNNEGKSNLLSALVCALTMAQERPGRRTLLTSRSPYVFQRDYPIHQQSRATAKPSKFMLEFELDAADKAEFRRRVGSKLSGTLRIQLSVNKDGEVTFSVQIQGPAQKALSAQQPQISVFISNRLQFQYIGALRSEEQSQEIVEIMVSRALMDLEKNADYQKALKLIEAAEKPLLERVSTNVESSLRPFLPSLTKVSTQISKEQRSRALRRSVEMWLDDGTSTPLTQKGDGVKSLVAIALAKAAAELSAEGRNLILAIEEPEAHLHSGAIHSLKSLLETIALERQVIISTHEPALVRRDNLGANVLVENNKANPATSLEEVRRVLGIQLGENLVSPDLIVLVEGPNDENLLEAYIASNFPKLKGVLQGGRLAFRALNGAANLPHQLRFYRSLVCDTLAFIDDDTEGENAYRKAQEDGLIDALNTFQCSCLGLKEAELEDLIDPGIYSASLYSELGISKLRPKSSRAQKAKWSTRIAAVLVESGKPKTDIDALVAQAKYIVATQAAASPSTCFVPALTGPIDALVGAIERKLGIE